MSKDSLVAVANTSAAAGTTTGVFAFLSENSSAITLIFVALTFFVTTFAHWYDKKAKLQKNKIEIEKLKLEKQKMELENMFRERELMLMEKDNND